MAHDLSSYDSILDLPFKIPFYEIMSASYLAHDRGYSFLHKINNDMMNTGSSKSSMKLMST
jgi:hypothetical protein